MRIPLGKTPVATFAPAVGLIPRAAEGTGAVAGGAVAQPCMTRGSMSRPSRRTVLIASQGRCEERADTYEASVDAVTRVGAAQSRGLADGCNPVRRENSRDVSTPRMVRRCPGTPM